MRLPASMASASMLTGLRGHSATAMSAGLASCVQPNECRCRGSASDADESTKKCTVWIGDGKCGATADCDPDNTNTVCKVDPANPLDGTCVDCLTDNECDDGETCESNTCEIIA